MIKVEKERIERIRELMLRVTPNEENKHDFNEAFVIVSKMIFLKEED